jgi:drug/metabolite transporter (DMT)-like permease
VFVCLMVARRVWRLGWPVCARGLALGILQAGSSYCLFQGFDHAPVALVVLLFYIYPLIATIGGIRFLGEAIDLRRGAALTCGLCGIALAVGIPGAAPAAGIAFGLGAGVCLGTNVVLGRRLMAGRSLSALDLVPLMYLGPAVTLGLVAVLRHADLSIEPAGWASAVALVVVSTITPTLLFWIGVGLIGAGPASLLATVEPFVAVLLGYAVLGQSLTALQLIGGLMVVSAVVLVSLPRGRPAFGARRRCDQLEGE